MNAKLKLLSILEVADILDVSKRTVDRMIASGDFSIVKVKGSTKILLSEVENYIELNTTRSGAAA